MVDGGTFFKGVCCIVAPTQSFKTTLDDLTLRADKKNLLDSMITASLITDIKEMAETYLERQKKKGGK